MRVLRDINNLPKIHKPVVTIGSFDGLHLGHRKLISRIKQVAKEIEGESTLITFHPHPRMIIDPDSVEMLNTLDEKIKLLESLGLDNLIIVPFTIEFSQQTPQEYVENFLISKIKPACIVIGYDHKFGHNRQGGLALLQKYEDHFVAGVLEISKKEIDNITISSSKIRSYLKAGEIDKANALLDYKYLLSGVVKEGDKIGRTLGYPTANLELLDKSKLLPKVGVYAARCEYNNAVYNGMLYIGPRPTLSGSNANVIEMHLFDFDGTLYEEQLTISIYDFIREDIKFESLDQLKHQLQIDESNTKEYFENRDNYSPPIKEVSIIILTHNSVDRIERFLPEMSESYTNPFNIVIIDNDSTDETVNVTQDWFPEVNVIQLNKNHGYAGGYNKGIPQIETKYVVLLNDDIQITKNWLDNIIAIMDADESIGACMPSILSYTDKRNYEYAGAAGGYIDKYGIPFCRGRILGTIEPIQEKYNDVSPIFWASGAALVTRRDLFINFEGFDTSFFAHQEEIDYCWRLKRAGYQIKVIGQSQVYHVGGSTLDYNNPRKTYLNFRNNHWLLLKNERWIHLLYILPFRFCSDTASSLYYLLQGKLRHTFAILRGIFSAYVSLRSILSKRRRAREIVEKYRIGKPNTEGRSRRSILIDYYIRRRKTFQSLHL